MTRPSADLAQTALQARALRAYELGRLRAALPRAAVVTAVATLLGSLGDPWLGAGALYAAPATFLIWLGLGWRGGGSWIGGQYGLAAAVVTSLLPLSLLRPCCASRVTPSEGMVCTMPELCVLAGALVALPLAVMLLAQRTWPRHERVVGMLLGVLSLGAVPCRALFAGEALGLFAGLALGLFAASALQTFSPRRS